jgi:hypothetical protein
MVPGDAKPHDGYMRTYRKDGVARIIGRQREAVARRRSGEIFPIELAVAEITLEEGRKFVGVMGSFAQRYVKRHGPRPPFRSDFEVPECDPAGNYR